MNRRYCVLALLCTLVTTGAAAAQDIDDTVKAWMEKQHVPAVSIAVIKDGSLVKAEGYGLADVEHRIPARAGTVFKIGSVSKHSSPPASCCSFRKASSPSGDRISKDPEGTPATWEAITIRHLAHPHRRHGA